MAAVIKKGEKRENPFREKKIFDATSFPAADDDVKEQLEEQGEDEDEDLVVDKQQLAEMEG